MLKSVWVFVVKRGSCLSLQSLWSQDTQAMGVLIFNQQKKRRRIKREEKKRRPWPRKYFLVHLLPGLWETSHEDPSKRSCSAVDRAVATERSKSSCRNGRGLPRQGTQSSAVNHMWGFHAMGTGPLLCTPSPPTTVLLSQVLFVVNLPPPSCWNSLRSKVTHSPFIKQKQGAREIMRPNIPPLYPFAPLLPVCTANIISARCHYGATAAGNVSPAYFQQRTHQHGPFSSFSSHSTADFCLLIGKHKLQVITSRFSTAQTMGIYSSGFLFKLSCWRITKPRCLFSND